jgi:hypothetical protein
MEVPLDVSNELHYIVITWPRCKGVHIMFLFFFLCTYIISYTCVHNNFICILHFECTKYLSKIWPRRLRFFYSIGQSLQLNS